MEQIRLIIWDLDHTLWQGIFSEESVIIPQKNKDILNTLVDRGIMNSICSKNDYDNIKKFLIEENIWDLFVFPKISWNPKGEQVRKIVEQMKLRPQSILFVDDSVTNIEEVKFYVDGINTAFPDIIDTILDDDHYKGKDDSSRSRLNQYKILERKENDLLSSSSNIDFLNNANIMVEMNESCLENIERIYELLERSNQLNFTKKRISKSEFIELLNDINVKNGFVTVKDNYGDYGLIGFYSILNETIKHFFFSCRTLGLGVEQWVYYNLGC
jgi:FkbH-like protein